jgi:hypothetical protein
MKTQTQADPIELWDPWPTAPENVAGSRSRTPGTDPDVPPVGWFSLSPLSRARLGGAIMFVLPLWPNAARRDVGMLTARVQAVLHARSLRAETKVTSAPLQIDLVPLYVADDAERAKWHKLAMELSGPDAAPFVVRNAVEALIEAGTCLATLAAKRAAIDEQITRLQRLRPSANGAGK